MDLIRAAQIEALKDEAMHQAEVNAARIEKKVDFAKVAATFIRISGLKILPKAKILQMWEAADAVCKEITPLTACKQGCSHCCNIAVTLTTTEAQIIGKHIGRKPQDLKVPADIFANISKYSGVPCPFLKKGRCSIYTVRPLACRLHFNLADSPYFCNVDIPPTESVVPQINTEVIDEAHFNAFQQEVWADMRDFFPPK